MIDVVFLLLIFFISTLSFNPLEDALDSQITQAAFASTTAQPEFEPILIRVISSAENTSIVQIICDDRVMTDFNTLRQYLRARRAVVDVPVIIQGSSHVQFKNMAAVLDACYDARFTRIAFSPKEYGK